MGAATNQWARIRINGPEYDKHEQGHEWYCQHQYARRAKRSSIFFFTNKSDPAHKYKSETGHKFSREL